MKTRVLSVIFLSFALIAGCGSGGSDTVGNGGVSGGGGTNLTTSITFEFNKSHLLLDVKSCRIGLTMPRVAAAMLRHRLNPSAIRANDTNITLNTWVFIKATSYLTLSLAESADCAESDSIIFKRARGE